MLSPSNNTFGFVRTRCDRDRAAEPAASSIRRQRLPCL
uniref:Uncharacterized protein n=1 Tax=Anopheles albimanus TaxID=7167 RepID=A0A182FXR2_ANOAL